jgi:MoxR-like ATPase
MSFETMENMLAKAYDQHIEAVRSKQLASHGRASVGRSAANKPRIPVLSGPSGIGKTACVKQFARQKGFELLELDCSFMPSSHLATRMFVAIEQIISKQITGCVVLIDNINEADAGWRALLDQYTDHYFDALLNTADAAAPGGIGKERQKIGHLPENLFVIGEQRPD